MAKGGSKRLVIDASVARSATNSENPVSATCRKFLQEVRDVCHRVVLTPEIDREWDYNVLRVTIPGDAVRLAFLYDWLAGMKDRGKILRPASATNPALRRKINKLGLPQTSRSRIIEDIHLVEAALAADLVVVSRDDEVQRLFR